MSEQFDPYFKWFGIPPKDRPIHCYRLLGVEPFESDPEVIENASDQRMAHLKRLATSKYAPLAEKLLNELAAARICLLNPAKKAKYDQQLRQQLAEQNAVEPMVAAVVAEPASFLTELDSLTSKPRRAAAPSKPKTPWLPIAAVAAGLLVTILIVMFAVPKQGADTASLPGSGTAGSGAVAPSVKPAPAAGAHQDGKHDDGTQGGLKPAAVPPQQVPSQPPKSKGPEVASAPVVLPTDNAEIMLTPTAAQLHGDRLKCSQEGNGPGRLYDWSADNAWASWDFRPVPGLLYRLEINYACDLANAGSICDVGITSTGQRSTSIRMTVQPTGPTGPDWNNYSTRSLGLQRFAEPGPYSLAVKVNHKAREWVMDLKWVRLVPAGIVAQRAPSPPPGEVASLAPGPSAPPLQPAAPEIGSGPHVSEPAGVSNPAAPLAAAKLSPPDEATKKAAEKEVQEVYAKGLAAAKSSEQKVSMAREIAHDAEHTNDNPAARYVMLQLAYQQARDGGDGAQAMEILAALDASYDVNIVPMKVDLLQKEADALTKASKTLSGRSPAKIAGQQQASQEILDACRTLTAAALDHGDVTTALRCLHIALPAARRLRDPKTVTQIQSSIKDVEKLQERADQMQASLAALAAKPDDPAANLTVGSWYCLVSGQWDKGLPYLAKAADADLTEPAQHDLTKPDSAAQQTDCGDRWWSLGEKKSGLEASRLKARAAYWYRLALPQSNGLGEAKLIKRLESLGISTGHYALKFDGQASYAILHGVIYDGNTPLTIEAIVKTDNAQNPDGRVNFAPQCLVGTGDYNGLSLGPQFRTWYYRFAVSMAPGSRSIYNMAGGARSDDWTHVALSYDGHLARFYLAGVLQQSGTVPGQLVPSPLPLAIGARVSDNGNVSEAFQGMIRSFRVTKRIVYTENFTPPTQLKNLPGTIALFEFSEGRGNELKDAAGRKIFGEIHDAQWVKLSK